MCRKLDGLQMEQLKEFILTSDCRNRQRHFVQYVQETFGVKISTTIIKQVLHRYNITFKQTEVASKK